MDDENQKVVLVGEAQQPRAQQRAAGEVERPGRFVRGPRARPRVAFRRRNFPQILRREREGALPGGDDFLKRLAVAHREARAQRLVAAHEIRKGGGERRRLVLPAQTDRSRHMVGRAAGLQLLDKPNPALAERERQRPVAGDQSERARVG